MDHNIFVSDMHLGQELEGFYLLNDPAVKTSANGKTFLTGKLTDRTGSIELKFWDYTGPISSADAGKVVKVRAEISEFKGTLQLNVRRLRFADPEQDDYQLSDLVPTAPIDVSSTFADVEAMVASLSDRDYRRICETMLNRHKKTLCTIPAAKSVHHGFLSGLLMHTTNMMRLADFLSGQYSEVIDRSLLIAGTLLHDFAKEKEFLFSELGLVTDYSLKGNLLGHLVMGAQEVAEVAKELSVPEDKSVLLQHMILSHHGEPEYGAAVVPKCAESELLSFIDMIDSRMEIYAETFQDLPVGQFSSSIFALGKKIYHHE